jgi:hypothetical protein
MSLEGAATCTGTVWLGASSLRIVILKCRYGVCRRDYALQPNRLGRGTPQPMRSADLARNRVSDYETRTSFLIVLPPRVVTEIVSRTDLVPTCARILRPVVVRTRAMVALLSAASV